MSRPDVTRAQVIASIAAGVPIFVSLLAAFGVWHPSKAETDALQNATGWAAGFAGLLVLGDAHLRAARNRAHALTARPPVNGGSVPYADTSASGLYASAPRSEGIALGPVDVKVDGEAIAEHVRADLAKRNADTNGDPDLDDPLLDDPHAGESGIDVNALRAHALGAATPRDLAERDEREREQAADAGASS